MWVKAVVSRTFEQEVEFEVEDSDYYGISGQQGREALLMEHAAEVANDSEWQGYEVSCQVDLLEVEK